MMLIFIYRLIGRKQFTVSHDLQEGCSKDTLLCMFMSMKQTQSTARDQYVNLQVFAGGSQPPNY